MRGAKVFQATIANGASLSGEVDIRGWMIVAVEIGSGWQTATSMTFQAARADQDGASGTFVNMYRSDNEGSATELSLGVAASRLVAVDNPAVFAAVDFVKVRSGTSGSATNQSGGDTVYLHVIPVE